MRKLRNWGILVAALVVLPLSSASATDLGTKVFGYYCTNALNACATATVNVTESGGNYYLTLKVWNLYDSFGNDYLLKAFGVYHSSWAGGITAWDVEYDSSSIKSYWTQPASEIGGFSTSAKGSTGNTGIVGCNSDEGSDTWETCITGDNKYVEFTFTLTGWDTQLHSVNDFEFAFHGISVDPSQDSDKCYTGDAGSCTLVPEPFTVALLGTGLAGIAGVGARRRRNRKDEV